MKCEACSGSGNDPYGFPCRYCKGNAFEGVTVGLPPHNHIRPLPVSYGLGDLHAKLECMTKEMAEQYNIAVENLTMEQVATLIKQAILSGDFMRLVHQDGQHVEYLPYRFKEQCMVPFNEADVSAWMSAVDWRGTRVDALKAMQIALAFRTRSL